MKGERNTYIWVTLLNNDNSTVFSPAHNCEMVTRVCTSLAAMSLGTRVAAHTGITDHSSSSWATAAEKAALVFVALESVLGDQLSSGTAQQFLPPVSLEVWGYLVASRFFFSHFLKKKIRVSHIGLTVPLLSS